MTGKCLTEKQRNECIFWMLERSKNGCTNRGVHMAAAERYGVCKRTISTLWKLAKTQMSTGTPINLKAKRFGNTNHPKLVPNIEQIKALDKEDRSTIAILSHKIEVSVGTIHKWIKLGFLRPHTSPLHPTLNDKNKIDRLKFAMNALNYDPILSKAIFSDMTHTVHIDEKWFFITRESELYYLVPEEEDVYRSVQSKRYITKVMFMCAVTKPMYNEDGSLLFDGKIAIFPFTTDVPAARNSRNGPAGTIETKATTSITKQVIRECVINKIIPAIKAKWPLSTSTNINIQQDNAKPHIDDKDPQFRAAASSDGFNIHLVNQPANSPDLNCNDLRFFRALQSLQTKTPARTVPQLIEAVSKAFDNYTHQKLNYIFISLQTCMVEIMKTKGNNAYKVPHIGIDRLARLGQLPDNLEVIIGIVQDCIDYLQQLSMVNGVESLMEQLENNMAE